MNPIAVSITKSGSYGALELKQDYRRNMLLSIAIAATLAFVAVVGMLTILAGKPAPLVLEDPVVRVKMDITMVPLPRMDHKAPDIAKTPPKLPALAGGIPFPVPDDEVIQDPRFPTSEEKAQLSAAAVEGFDSGEGNSFDYTVEEEDYWPAPEEFTICQEYPKQVHFEIPGFPEMAELTGQTGIVWIRALVDREGHVRDAHVQKPSGTNVGFEEAALSAALKNVYRPAIQNGQPVAVWISYKVEFRLR
jgi:TonB family protein